MKKHILVGQSGGPTAVINASLYGVIREGMAHPEAIDHVYGMVNGIEGFLSGHVADLSHDLTADQLELLKHTPAAYLGSCRYKLPEDLSAPVYPLLFEKFRQMNIGACFYIGGNDSMDTVDKLSRYAASKNVEIPIIGIPKTIDNDLAVTDHCPGFGSAAKYAAVSALEIAQDASALPIHVVVMELMGRNAGWITAASALFADKMPCEHLVYLPEVAFDKTAFLAAVKEKFAKGKGLLVTISEGIHYADGSPVADSGVVDGFGHKVPGGAAQTLCDMVMAETGLKARSEKPGLLGRVSVALMSPVDQREAEEAGAVAVRSAVEGKTGFMVGFQVDRAPAYACKTCLIPLEDVANAEKKFPLGWIGQDGCSIDKAFIDYCLPLLGECDTRFAAIR